ncbi:hypothetical protein RJT34_25261 [Clitoria ternatea]|uniref:Uncharacterized protein n=1 Tax=Clitoria ternatea TaxID=43366 RepID=A0AAN9FPK7_CLITE
MNCVTNVLYIDINFMWRCSSELALGLLSRFKEIAKLVRESLDLLKYLFGHEFADEVGNLLGFTMFGVPWAKSLERTNDSLGLSFQVGQPLGYYSSWAFRSDVTAEENSKDGGVDITMQTWFIVGLLIGIKLARLTEFQMGIALPQFLLNIDGASGGILLLWIVSVCILLPLVVVVVVYLSRSSKYTERVVSSSSIDL